MNTGLVNLGTPEVAITEKTESYNPETTDDFLSFDCTSGNLEAVLPPAADALGKRFTFKKTDASANTLTIDGNGAETIDGSATLVIGAQYGTAQLVSTGTEWLTTAPSIAGLTVEAASVLNQDVTTDAKPTFAGVSLTAEADVTSLNRTSGDLTLKTTTSGDVDINPVSLITRINSGSTTNASTPAIYFGDDTGGVAGIRSNNGAIEYQDNGGGWTGLAGIGGGGGVPKVTLYTANTATNISNSSYKIIDFDDQVLDDGSYVTTGASWKFTPANNSVTWFHAQVTLGTTSVLGLSEDIVIRMLKYSGSASEYLRNIHYMEGSPAGAFITMNLSGVIKQTTGTDYYYIDIFQRSGSTVPLQSSYTTATFFQAITFTS